MLRALVVLVLSSLSFIASAEARAPDTFEEDYHEPVGIDSPMWMALEIKLGPYLPGRDAVRKSTFGDDRGWMLNLELDVTVFHIPYVGQLNVAAGWGWANYDAKAIVPSTGSRSGEETELTLYPLSALAILRVDVLARETVVPITFAGKFGHEWVRYKATTGERTDKSGFLPGLRWGAQAALELDFFDRESARRMDEEWDVNHTFVLFEYYESMTKGTGDRTYQFGLGAQF
jgi:hypothetical protein